MLTIRSLVCIALLSSSALAAEPIAVISGKKIAKTGDLIVLSSADSTPDTKRKWTVWPELAGTPSEVNESLERWAASLREHGATVIMPSESDDSNSISIEDDSKLVLASYPGTYRIMLAVSNADGLDVAKWTVTVSATTPPDIPPPPPPPDDDDPPLPPPPPASFGLKPSVAGWLASVPAANLPQRQALRTALSAAGTKAANGDFATLSDAKAAAGTAIKDSGIDLQAWRMFGTSMNAAFDGLIATGRIVTARDYGRAMLEIGEGLAP